MHTQYWHAGKYTCKVESSSGIMIRDAYITVLGKAFFISMFDTKYCIYQCYICFMYYCNRIQPHIKTNKISVELFCNYCIFIVKYRIRLISAHAPLSAHPLN